LKPRGHLQIKNQTHNECRTVAKSWSTARERERERERESRPYRREEKAEERECCIAEKEDEVRAKKKRRRTAIDEECSEGECDGNESFSTGRLPFAKPLCADLDNPPE